MTDEKRGTERATPVYCEGGWLREGHLAICPECKAVLEGTISWHLEHESKCKWKPAGTWFEKRLAAELERRMGKAQEQAFVDHAARADRAELERLRIMWSRTSGALCDAGTVDTDDFEKGIRDLTAERDALRSALVRIHRGEQPMYLIAAEALWGEDERSTSKAPRFVVTHYHNELRTHCPYQFVLHDQADSQVDKNDILRDAMVAAGADDGDEVEIVVRRTGRRPFGDRRFVYTKPHTYEREPAEQRLEGPQVTTGKACSECGHLVVGIDGPLCRPCAARNACDPKEKKP